MDILIYTLLTLGILGFLSGLILYLASKKLSVPIDPKIEKIAEVLPGANCGACGHASCHALAKAIAEDQAAVTSCIPGGAKVAEEIAKIIGKQIDESSIIKKVAAVRCQGGKDKAKEKFTYIGIEDCTAATLVSGGHKACAYGCLGLSSCVKVCPFDAIAMNENSLPVVNYEKCTGCGKCVAVCPRKIIALIPNDQSVFIGCVSKDKLKEVKTVCSVGCIACGICTKPGISPEEVIKMGDNNLPEITWKQGQDLKTLLGNAISKCPSKCFVVK